MEAPKSMTIEITTHGNEINYFEPIAAYCSSSCFCGDCTINT